jgi:hypothetical protein
VRSLEHMYMYNMHNMVIVWIVGCPQLRERIKRICKSKRAQRVAVNIAGGLKKVCLDVVANTGAASRG